MGGEFIILSGPVKRFAGPFEFSSRGYERNWRLLLVEGMRDSGVGSPASGRQKGHWS